MHVCPHYAWHCYVVRLLVEFWHPVVAVLECHTCCHPSVVQCIKLCMYGLLFERSFMMLMCVLSTWALIPRLEVFEALADFGQTRQGLCQAFLVGSLEVKSLKQWKDISVHVAQQRVPSNKSIQLYRCISAIKVHAAWLLDRFVTVGITKTELTKLSARKQLTHHCSSHLLLL